MPEPECDKHATESCSMCGGDGWVDNDFTYSNPCVKCAGTGLQRMEFVDHDVMLRRLRGYTP